METKYFPKGNAFELDKYLGNHPKANKIKEFSSFDVQKLIEEDEQSKGMDVPFRFGKGFDTKITLANGEWTDIEGGRLWSMGFRSKGAYSINFVFDRLYLPDTARLYAANSDGTMLYGPVTSKQNTKNGYFLTDLIQGDEVFLYLYEPDTKKGKSELTIKRVVHAYKDLFPMSYGNLGGSLSCNNDIACYPAWDEESDAVALVLLSDGTELCSGSLLMTAGQTFEPYFLSAFHCIDRYSPYGSLSTSEISDAENWMFKFQYKMTSCGGSTATTGITYNGAEFRAAWNTTDFALMEMDESPVGDTRFSWLGWDRSDNIPTSGTSIHHPSGDVMKISFDYNSLTSNASQISWNNGTVSPINTHWVVGFDDGTTEGGSSGSPLFNQDKRVIGQLHGGLSGCPPVTKYYGQFHLSWAGGGTDNTRLSNWLDPCNSGATTTNTSRSPSISGFSTVCSSGASFTINNPPPGTTITWSNGSYLTRTSAQGANPCTFAATGSGSSWIETTLTTNCGNITLPRKTVYAGIPTNDNIDFGVFFSSPPYDEVVINQTIPIGVNSNSSARDQGVTGYNWQFGSWSSYVSGYQSYGGYTNGIANIYLTSAAPSQQIVQVSAVNACGYDWDSNASRIFYAVSDWKLMISPNPSSGETTISIEDTSGEKPDDKTLEWDLEIYDQNRMQKTKETDLKGREYKLNTSNWSVGVYVVRATVNKKVLTDKLVVK